MKKVKKKKPEWLSVNTDLETHQLKQEFLSMLREIDDPTKEDIEIVANTLEMSLWLRHQSNPM